MRKSRLVSYEDNPTAIVLLQSELDKASFAVSM